jgi:hypothetical protein
VEYTDGVVDAGAAGLEHSALEAAGGAQEGGSDEQCFTSSKSELLCTSESKWEEKEHGEDAAGRR